MSLQLRRVGAEATAEVLNVIRTAFEARPTLDPPADALADDAVTVAAELRAHGGLLVTEEDRPVGALLFRSCQDPGGATMLLRRFGVVPGAQGTGVAGLLVEGAVDATMGYAALAVLAREELPDPVSFWQRHGFVITERRPPYVELRRPLSTAWRVLDGEQMRVLGERLGRSVRAGDVVVLTGELGAGKTTLTQGLGAGLGVRGPITSPTFVIARVHPSLVDGPDLVHVDAYRLGGIEELDDLDLDTSLDDAVTVVEWGAGLAEGLAESRLEITISRSLADEAEDGEKKDADVDPRVVRARRVGG